MNFITYKQLQTLGKKIFFGLIQLKNMNSVDITEMKQLREFAAQILGVVSKQKTQNQATLITLSGNLGAGKTTFTQELAKLLEISESVSSPTYVIEQRYPIFEHKQFAELVHIDAYRLENENDPQKVGLDLTLNDPQKLVVIEWPQKIENFLKNYTKISISLENKQTSRNASFLS